MCKILLKLVLIIKRGNIWNTEILAEEVIKNINKINQIVIDISF